MNSPTWGKRWASKIFTSRADRGGIPIASVELDGAEPPNVRLTMGNLTARRLLLALGMNGRRYGEEVKAVTDGLSTLLVGQVAGEEPASPHGPGHDCPQCRLLRPLYPGSSCCNPCFWETPEQFMDFPTQCPHRLREP